MNCPHLLFRRLDRRTRRSGATRKALAVIITASLPRVLHSCFSLVLPE